MKSNTNRENHINKNNKSNVNKTKKIDFGINYVNTNYQVLNAVYRIYIHLKIEVHVRCTIVICTYSQYKCMYHLHIDDLSLNSSHAA